ncbi:MAG: 4Fe-4S dicluster domain-containing protein [Thermodesulfovibrionales bacterium]|nr:4Fe-4S dicluster domain-containing protein [Thermodesulfovibrionales bacterium]
MNERKFTRREILKAAGAGAALVLAQKYGVFSIAWADPQKKTLKMVVVDYSKCTGCRVCEAVCSSYNNPVIINGERLSGLGNPTHSRIRIHSFNPDVDIPNVCAMCPDAPCVNACPVNPEPKTGRKAIYRDDKTLTIQTDLERCISCGSCAKACAEKRTAVLELDPKTGKPRAVCNLCGGDPQCVKQCPFDALSMVEVNTNRRFYGQSPQKIAKTLSKQWYGVADLGGVK